jgi:hypothetical protein
MIKSTVFIMTRTSVQVKFLLKISNNTTPWIKKARRMPASRILTEAKEVDVAEELVV